MGTFTQEEIKGQESGIREKLKTKNQKLKTDFQNVKAPGDGLGHPEDGA